MLPPKKVMANLRDEQCQKLKKRLMGKLHRVCYCQIQRAEADKKATYKRLVERKLSVQTEGIIAEAQDGVTYTRAYVARVLKEPVATRCRVCGDGDETLHHILSAYCQYSWTLHKEHHDRVLFLLAKAILHSLEIPSQEVLEPSAGEWREPQTHECW